MSVNLEHLSVLAYAKGFTLWSYRTKTDTLYDVGLRDYFAPAKTLMSNGDMVMVVAVDGGRILLVTSSGFQQSVTTTAPVS